MGSMSENEIQPVAWVPPSFFDKGVVAATARRKPPSETAVAMRGEYSAIDNLMKARDALLEALIGLRALYDTDEGCRSTPEYIAASEAIDAVRSECGA